MHFPDHLYVCMYVCMYIGYIYVYMYVCTYFVVFLKNQNSYLYLIGDPQCDEEIDVEERDGEGGKTETMNVCMYVHMYEWMDVYGRGRYWC